MSKKVKAELMAIQGASKDKMLHPQHVVTWAKRHPTSALHRQFEWNNSKAATEYRLWQARRLIQINVTMDGGGPQLVSLSLDRINGGGYRDIRDVMSNKDLREMALAEALSELTRVQAKYERIQELAGVWAEVRRVRNSKTTRVAAPKRQMAKAA